MHVQSCCFANLNLLLFCRSRCRRRRRRRCLSSLMLEQCCNHSKQCRNNVVMLRRAKDRRYESSYVTSRGCFTAD